MLCIFDIDGTLCNSTQVDDECFIEAFEHNFGIDLHGIDWNLLSNVTDWALTEEIFFNHFNKAIDPTRFDVFKTDFISRLKLAQEGQPDQFREVKGAKQFLEILKEMGYDLAIATGAWRDSAIVKLNAIGIEHTSVPFSNSDLYKTREEIVSHILRMTQSQPQDCVYFGDGVWDWKCCQRLNLNFIGIDCLNKRLLDEFGVPVFKNYLEAEKILNVIAKYCVR